jgi:hypothetical protein
MKARILRLLLLSLALVAAAYLGSFAPRGTPVWAPWLLAMGTNGLIMSLMALGATRHDALPRSLVRTFIGLFVLCAGCFLVALLLPAREGAGGPLLLGLPVRTAIVLYGVGVLPMAVLPFAYASTFDEFTLRDDDLRRVREAAAEVRAARERA